MEFNRHTFVGASKSYDILRNLTLDRSKKVANASTLLQKDGKLL